MFRDHRFHTTPLSETTTLPLHLATPHAAHSAINFLGMDRLTLWILKAAIAEFVAVGAAAYFTSALYHAIAVPQWLSSSRYIVASIVIAALYSCASLGFRDFRKLQEQRYQQFLLTGLKSAAFALAFLLSGLFLFKIMEDYSRGTFLFQIVGICACVLGVRSLTFFSMRNAIASGRLEGRRAILIGDPAHQAQFSRRLKPFGVLTVDCVAISSFEENREQIVRQTITSCRELHADDILVLAAPVDLQRVAQLIDDLSQLPVSIHLVPVGAGQILTSEIAGLGDITTLQVLRPPLSTIDIAVKRLFDVLAAIFGLIMLWPLFLVAALAIKLDSRGPVFFRQERHGYNNRTITVIKFRSMYESKGETGFVQTSKDDPRVTRVGRVIRSTSIDELPQLFNVLRGEMSIVGPRPHATAHNAMFQDRILPFSRRHNVKPGITGWAQVNQCRGEADSLEKMKQRVDYDLFYIDNWSFLFDLKIIVTTFFLLLSKDEITNVY
jgi:Undecaprenyl-phosphate glucose phosphotransferase